MRLFIGLIAGMVVAVFATVGRAEDKATVDTLPSLASVTWAGPAPDPAFLDGKTVVVLTYVTWCPKCNAWTGNVAAELKQQSNEKPVVVLAVSTDTPPPEALAYMKQRGLTGPNVFHGFDPSIAARFGFSNKFINFAITGPDGTIVSSGNGGMRYSDENEPSYVVARCLAETENLGSFRFLDPAMPQAVKDRLWLLELGVTRDAKKLETGLEPEGQKLIRTSVESFLTNEIGQVEKLSASETTTDKLAAMHRATFLASAFGGAAEGRRAKELLGTLAKDKAIKDEMSAKRQYEAAMKVAEPARRSKAMDAIVKKLPDTVFGKKAARASAQP